MTDDFVASADALDRVEDALRKAAAEEVMPRFRQLGAHEITQKDGPHDLVTVAGQAAELWLERSLAALLPGSVLVGEEGVHAGPGRLAALCGDAPAGGNALPFTAARDAETARHILTLLAGPGRGVPGAAL